MARDDKNPMRSARLTVTFLACVLTTYACTELLDGVHADSMEAALMTGCVLGLGYLLMRPILRLLTVPLGCLTLGITNFVIDVLLLTGSARLIEGFSIDGVIPAVLAALIIDIVVLITGGRK